MKKILFELMMNKRRRVVYYLVDGARPDSMLKLLNEGKLPNLKQIVDEGTFRVATTCFPSTTGPAYLPFLTGHFPGTLNIPGIRWMDKVQFKRRRFFNKYTMRSYCGPEAGLFNSDMPVEKKTLLELIPESYNLYNMITRGVNNGYDIGKKGKAWLYMKAHFLKQNHPVDIRGRHRIMDMVRAHPDFGFLFAVFPSVDWDSHYVDVFSKETEEAYKIADESIGELREYLQKQNCWDDTLFVLTSDHGLTRTTQHLDVGDYFTEHGLKSVSYPVIWRLNPKVGVSVSGNSFASVQFFNHEGDRPLRGDEIKKYMGENLLNDFLHQPAIDFVCYRGEKNTDCIVENKTGHAIIRRDETGYHYLPQNGDPLLLGSPMHATGHREALEITFNTTYPDGLVQIEQLFRAARAGDMAISAAPGYDLRDFWEIPTHLGSHGSLIKAHMQVPMLYNKKGWATHSARTADLFPTILSWMGLAVPPSEGDSLIV